MTEGWTWLQYVPSIWAKSGTPAKENWQRAMSSKKKPLLIPEGFVWRTRRLAWWEKILKTYDAYLELVDTETGKVLAREGMFDSIGNISFECQTILERMAEREQRSSGIKVDKFTYLEL